MPIVERLVAEGNKPEELLADTGYRSGENIVGCAELDVTIHAPVQDPNKQKRRDAWIGAENAAATATRQREQQTPAFKETYKLRSGIESTNAELKGRHGLNDIRVRGKERVELALVLKALALKVKRAVRHHTERVRAGVRSRYRCRRAERGRRRTRVRY